MYVNMLYNINNALLPIIHVFVTIKICSGGMLTLTIHKQTHYIRFSYKPSGLDRVIRFRHHTVNEFLRYLESVTL